MPLLVRVAPAIGLWFVAPLTAEFLMGNIPVINVVAVISTTFMYGAGALVIREVARRTGRGWPSILAWALAFGIFEEAVFTQTLWNENWANVRILDYGYVPALGTGVPWLMFMVGVHTIWSISAPIAVVEALAGSRGTTPWLGKTGLRVVSAVFVLFFVLGGVAKAMLEGWFASPVQYVGAGVLVVALIVLGLRLRRGAPAAEGAVPGPWAVFAFALVAGAFFVLLYACDPTGLSPWLAGLSVPAWLSVLLYLALFAGVGVLVGRWSHRSGWSDSHRLALAAGAVLTYAWHSFPWKAIVPASPAADLVSNAIMTVGAVVLLVFAARRVAA
ncbi:hypothetical protein ACIBQ1_39475 [Nonomuraea sp. NPDC050153]|uniref:hypothetical protein n=1 Tax=Nonomuraea sp. NPDC050153 TaxID=3364359 RepID=UPI00379B2694